LHANLTFEGIAKHQRGIALSGVAVTSSATSLDPQNFTWFHLQAPFGGYFSLDAVANQGIPGDLSGFASKQSERREFSAVRQ
jgi:hypothetical protein